MERPEESSHLHEQHSDDINIPIGPRGGGLQKLYQMKESVGEGWDGDTRASSKRAMNLFVDMAHKSRHYVEWSPDDDAALVKATLSFPMRKNSVNWSRIAEECGLSRPRTAKQCRERYQNHLDPKLNRAPWRDDEDKLIIELQQQHGNSWAAISRALGGGRTEHSVKNRFICLRKLYGIRDVKITRKRTRDDEKNMRALVAKHRASMGIDNIETRAALKDVEPAADTVECLLSLGRGAQKAAGAQMSELAMTTITASESESQNDGNVPRESAIMESPHQG